RGPYFPGSRPGRSFLRRQGSRRQPIFRQKLQVLHAMKSLAAAWRCFVAQPLRGLTHRPAGQVPALDALRTCAVLIVLCAHLTVAYLKHGGIDSWLARFPLVKNGGLGVDLFFVLSGYFIGKQLWRELARTGTIHFSRFVFRRGLRIWPLF